MDKASVKHLDFQLQREKALTKDLDAKCKLLSAQIAQLEQDKAELRREKLLLGEEAKKASKLEDRIHNLQKEVEHRDGVIAAERAAAQEARVEAEEVRRNANASIALWTAAEEQWTAEQAALNEAATQYRLQIDALEREVQVRRDDTADVSKHLLVERDRVQKLTQARELGEAEVKALHQQVEKLQNKVCDLEQTVYKLDLAGDKQREAIHLKDAEIKSLEATLARHVETEERMEQSISSLNDRINAAKMMNLEGQGENEKLHCDIADAKKEIDRLLLQIESLKRDSGFLAQSHSSVQKALEELKEKHRQLQEDSKEKTVEIRRQELTISQLHVELKKSESNGGEWSFQNSSLAAELQQTKAALKKANSAAEMLHDENSELVERARALKQLVESKEEEMVLLQSQCEERTGALLRDIDALEKDIAARQAVINDMSSQLNLASEKHTVYHSKILEGSETTGKVLQQVSLLLRRLHAEEQRSLLLECGAEKEQLFADFLADGNTAQRVLGAQQAELCQRLHGETCVLQEHTEELAREVQSKVAQIVDVEVAAAAQKRENSKLRQEALSYAERCTELAHQLVVRQDAIDELRRVAKESNAEKEALKLALAELRDEVATRDNALTRSGAAVAAAKDRSRSLSDDLLVLEQRFLHHIAAQTNHMEQLWSSRVDAVASEFAALRSQWKTDEAALRSSKEQAEATCRELCAFAKEAKVSMNKSDLAAAERQEALASRATLLEGQVTVARRERDQASAQLSTLLRRFEEDKKATEAFRRQAEGAMERELARCEAASKEAAKLRAGVEAEVRRKCEYKQAVEELKKLRAESEELRRGEKERAAEAIRKANAESNYWVTCFDHLKQLVEKSRRTGNPVPSIDADMIHRLEAAKAKISPIQARDTNVAPGGVPQLKRARQEPSEAPA
ncbi:hypothetical protein NESM_000761100 [Novymonas esmeraldas]|uniref:Uncharacterized protein n=1 Tax=Novymonas esmeraldas TaxID=1808958 RepID=A0AAW0EWD4_9TRYP